MKQELASSRAKITELWKMSYIWIQEYDTIVAAKDDEIAELRSQISDALRSSMPEIQDVSSVSMEMTTSVGKVPREARQAPQLTHLLERTQIFGLKIG